jgi:signal-transduction protein with cAMP-binding, CBS, and nucleotidyltransferase domain
MEGEAMASLSEAKEMMKRNGVQNQYLVKDWMTSPVYVIHADTPVADAYNLMMQRSIRRLPVVEKDRLVGIVTLGDLREARPSPATSLSIYELNYLLSSPSSRWAR